MSAASTAAGAANGEPSEQQHYGDASPTLRIASKLLHLRDLGAQNVGQTVKLRAWVQNARMQGSKMAFVELREERNWSIQGVLVAGSASSPSAVTKPMVKWVAGLPAESYVCCEGTVQRVQRPVKSCRIADFEIQLARVFCVARAPETLGLSLASANRAVSAIGDEEDVADKVAALEVGGGGGGGGDAVPAASLATHLSNPVMHKRAPVSQAIADVRIATRKIFTEYMDARGFNQFEPPCLLGAASEGGANFFKLGYFGKEAYLAQSPQFYKQIEIAGGRKKVYCIGPTFRAENSNTPRHMTEFTCLDLETEIEEHYHEVRNLLESLLLHIFRELRTRCAEQIELVQSIYQAPSFLIPEPGHEVRLTFAEGQALLRAEGPPEYRDVRDDEDMSTPQEKALGALVRRKFGTDFYFLDKFPAAVRPFYAMEDPDDPGVTNSFDFFMRGQEILTGGQRIHDPAALEARIRKKGIDPASPGIKEYLAVFQSAGVPPHGGGGIGLDRVVTWFLGLPTVHLASYYPRTPKRLLP